MMSKRTKRAERMAELEAENRDLRSTTYRIHEVVGWLTGIADDRVSTNAVESRLRDALKVCTDDIDPKVDGGMTDLESLAQVIIGYIKSGDRGGKTLGQTILDAGYRKMQVVDGVEMVPNGYFWKGRAEKEETDRKSISLHGLHCRYT